ncbi:MAG: hypothetical protein ACFFAZ_00440 [Promethearchaeota archaeon]
MKNSLRMFNAKFKATKDHFIIGLWHREGIVMGKRRSIEASRRVRFVAIAVTLIVLMSTVSIVAIGIATFAGLPIQEDVLILRVGDSKEIASASATLAENLKSHNEIVESQWNSADWRGMSQPQFVNQGTTPVVTQTLVPHIDYKESEVALDKLAETIREYQTSFLVVVAHGSSEGIADSRSSATWEDIAHSIKTGRVDVPVFLSCYSSEIEEYLPAAIGFPGEIDAQIAAIALSASIVAAFDGSQSEIAEMTGQFIDRVAALEARPESYEPLANWRAIQRTVNTIMVATPAPKTYWTDSAVALKIMGMILGVLLLIILDNLSASAAKILGVLAATVVAVSCVVGIIGDLTGLSQMFKVRILWGTIDLWPLVKIAVGLLVCGFILAFGTPLIALMNLAVRNGAGLILYSLMTYFFSSLSYNSIFAAIARIFGNTLGDLTMPIFLFLFGLFGISLTYSERRLVRTCVYLLCVIFIYSAVDHLLSGVGEIFDVSKSISDSMFRTLTIWNICCWTVDWAMWLGGA